MKSAFFPEVRDALRHLRRSPGFAAAAIITLALGIGANTATFSVLNTLLLKRLAVNDPDGLIFLTGLDRQGRHVPTPISVVGELANSGPLRDVCGYNGGISLAVAANGSPTQAALTFVTGACFRTLGVTPIFGRSIVEEDAPLFGPGKHVALISHRFWTRVFGSDPKAIGSLILANHTAVTIIGVLPPGFRGLHVDAGEDVFLPFDTVIPTPAGRRPFATQILGRLRHGIEEREAAAELTARWHALLQPAVPAALPPNVRASLLSSHLAVEPVGTGLSKYREQYARPVLLISGLTALLLLLACVNVGGLFLARVAARRTELTIRMALGAPRSRIGFQIMAEGLVLAAKAWHVNSPQDGL